MKKNVLKRLLAMLLALVMLLSAVPMGAFAAVGDILVGDTGIVNDSLGDGGTINWPVKIYDYLNDGMLFEPATSSLTNGNIKKDSVLDGWYGLYGGGTNMPVTLQGTDYTGNSAHYGSGDSTASITTLSKFLNYTKIAAEHFVSPQYMRVEKLNGAADSRMCLVNFTRSAAARKKTDGYQQCLLYDDVRYMTLVYKSQGTGNDDETEIWLESRPTASINSNGFVTYSSDWGRVKIDIDIPDSAGWRALVIDLATVDSQMINNDTGLVTTWDQWAACTAIYLKLAGIDTGDYLDISHFAVFGSREEAELYGQRCLEFNNNPGECLLQARTITWTTGGDGQETTITLPTAADPGFTLAADYATLQNAPQEWDSCSTSSPTVSGSSRNYFIRPGLDLTRQGARAYGTSSYSRWSTATSYRLFHGADVISFTSTPLSVTPVEDGNRDHVQIRNNGDSRFVLETFCEDSTYGLAQGRVNHMVMVYRTKGFTGSEQYGLWATGCIGYGAKFNDTTPDTSKNFKCISYVSGIDWQTSSVVYKQSFQNSEDLWVADVIPLDTTVGAVDGDWGTLVFLKHMGMYLPALNNGKSLDLAYIAFFTEAESANYFSEKATAYMNSGKTYTTSDSPVQTHTVTFPAGRTWNAGNNGVFGMYHGNQGGSWASGGYGGSSTNVSNGYYTYRIGYAVGSDYSTLANQNRMPFGNTAARYSQYTLNTTTKTLDLASEGRTNQIFYVGSANPDGDSVAGFNTGILPLDGYNLLTNLTTGGCTIGMLEGISKDGRPVYRQETVEYIAEMLYNALPTPQFDKTGNYNYNFISGAKSSQFATDLNGDGDKSDMFDTNGDQVKETNEASMDLATALRREGSDRHLSGLQRLH